MDVTTDAGASAQRIGDVCGETVVVVHHRRDSALSIARGRIGGASLGDDDDAAELRRLQRGQKTRDARANDKHVARTSSVGAGHVAPLDEASIH